jgi:hypothetical protein
VSWITNARGQVIYGDGKAFAERLVVVTLRRGSQVGVNDGNMKAHREVCLLGVEPSQRSPHCVNVRNRLVGLSDIAAYRITTAKAASATPASDQSIIKFHQSNPSPTFG